MPIRRHNRLLGAVITTAVLPLLALTAVPAGATVPAPDLAGTRAPDPSGVLTFAGYPWTVRSSSSPVGPGPNDFAANGPFVDASGALHLRILHAASGWESSEVVLGPTLGYGTYTWTLRGSLADLDPNVVLGLITYDASDTSPTNREIDFEASRFGQAGDATNAQYVVQPWYLSGNLLRITVPKGVATTVSLTWLPGSVSYSGQVVRANGRLMALPTWTDLSSSVPTSSTEQIHMNLWLFQGVAPSNGKPVDVVVTGFQFVSGL